MDGSTMGFVRFIDGPEKESQCWGDAPSDLSLNAIGIADASDLNPGQGTEMTRSAIVGRFAPSDVEGDRDRPAREIELPEPAAPLRIREIGVPNHYHRSVPRTGSELARFVGLGNGGRRKPRKTSGR